MEAFVPLDDKFSQGQVQTASGSYQNVLCAQGTDGGFSCGWHLSSTAGRTEADVQRVKIKWGWGEEKTIGTMRHIALAKLNMILTFLELALGLLRCEPGRSYQTQACVWEEATGNTVLLYQHNVMQVTKVS